ncbi:glycosyltransferase family 1 protein [Alteromonas aestuariivivens]|uniref:Glycosyltransferase family 1 protein n=1 Tax=Alteromonas aestuariivivens TaxID=1938339 RepID=A0A3D8MB53_9ALTE|nr:glycosyltransferase family 4 protein [Alteromonas aestuariivivens]RDV27502.1 glycosyltransferase family 1 protein [Alteromonas aestuariivivens]
MQRKLKIAMVASCPFPANHGTPGAIRELSLFLHKQGHEVHVVTYPQYEEGLTTEGLIIHRVESKRFKDDKITIGPSKSRVVYDYLLIPKLIEVIRTHDIDIIHAHNYEANIAGWVAKLFTKTPLVYNGINSMADELPTYNVLKPKWFFRAFGKLLDYIVPRMGNASMVLSDELKGYLTENMNINSDKVFVIPPGVDPSLFSHGNRQVIFDKLSLSPDTPIILYTGAIEGFQRIDLLMRAMGTVAKQMPEAKLLIAGNVKNDKAKTELLKLAEEVGAHNNVIMVENVSFPQLPDFLDAATVTVSPRTSCPGYPIKLLNYMAAGKAIVSFAGSAKALCHGYNGYVAKDEDTEDFAKGILMLLKDPQLSAVLGQRAFETIQGNFDWDAIARGTVEIYAQLVDRGQIDTARLRNVVKKSYIPEFVEVTSAGSSFLKEGVLTFPQYDQ